MKKIKKYVSGSYFLLNKRLPVLALVLFSLFAVGNFADRSVAAACASLPTTYGQVVTNVTIPSTGIYKVWSRLSVPDTTANSYFLEVDDTTCGLVVGDSTSISPNAYTWVDYKDGSSTNKLTLSLAAGSHQIKLVGREGGVKLDKVIFLSDLNCNPNVTDCEAAAADTAPAAPIGLSAAPGSGVVALSWTPNNEADLSYYKTQYKKTTDTTWLNGSNVAKPGTSYTFNGLTNGTAYEFRVAAVDIGSNVSNYSTVGATPTAPQDTVPPTVTISSPANNATVKGVVPIAANATDNVKIDKVEFYVDNSLVATDTTSPYSYSWPTTTVAEDQNHTLTAKAYDGSNAPVQSTPVSVKVDNVDNIAPVVTLSSPVDGATLSGQISITASATDNVGVVASRILVDGVQKTTSTSGSINFAWATTPSDNGSHVIRAESSDASGNISYDVAITTIQNADTTAPAVPGGLVATATDGKITLNWNANTESDFAYYSVRFKKFDDPDVGSSWTWPATQLTTNSYTFSGLTNSVRYNVEVRAIDKSLNKSAYATTQATPTGADTTAPSAPTNLTATAVSSTQINLKWSASTSTDTSSYRIYRNGALIKSDVTSASFGNTGLLLGITYVYEIQAVDASGNVSEKSSSATALTVTDPNTGNSAGTVKASTGEVLGGYVFTYIGKTRVATRSSDATGFYVLTLLPPNEYKVIVHRRSYARNSTTSTVKAGQTDIREIIMTKD